MRVGGSASRRDWARTMTEEQFDELRRSAFAIAYRMLSVSEAEDIVQGGFLRLPRTA
jgi:DNA-directed RNA polymerase specialized sigma24 family protein